MLNQQTLERLYALKLHGMAAAFQEQLGQPDMADRGLAPLNDTERRDLLEVLEDRYGLAATIVTSQVPISLWHDCIGRSHHR